MGEMGADPSNKITMRICAHRTLIAMEITTVFIACIFGYVLKNITHSVNFR